MNKANAKVFALAGVLSAALLAGCSDSDNDYYYTYNKTASSSQSSGKTQVTVTLSGDLGEVSATVSSGEVLSFTLDGYSCTGSGYVWLCQAENSDEDGEELEAYVVTLSYDNGTWSYTAQAVKQEEAKAETGSKYTADVVLWLSDDGEVLFVTADGIACTSCDDDSWVYESDGTTYLLELTQGEDGEWTYTISLYIASGITIVLPQDTTEDDLEAMASAIANYENITLDMSKMKLTEIKGAGSAPDGVFYKCTSLISVILPDGLTKIGGYAFADCSALTSISIPSTVTTIGPGAFYNCSSLSEISIPSSVTTIGEQVFSGCTSLISISIPSGVTSIGDKTFLDCSSLASISIPSSVTTIGQEVFSGCSSLTSISIPSSVTSIGIKVFYKCSSLSEITISSSVTSIEKQTFYSCTSLTNITIPSGVTTIEEQAFSDCTSLASISIPSSVTSIGYKAFYNCTALGNVTYGGTVSQFKSLVEGSNFGKNNTCLTSATTITCSNGTYSTSSD